MPIIPALSQEVYKYDDTTLVGRSNTFIGFPINYNTFYRIFGALPFGVDIVDVDFSFKWDTTAQTITIESTDVDFDLQGSTLLFNPYTNDTDVCVINIGLGDTQPTELNKAVFRYTVEAGVVSPWTQLRFAIIERKGQVKSNPADPRELANETNSMVTINLNTATVTSTILADIVPTFTMPIGDKDTPYNVTSSLGGSDVARKNRTTTLSGTQVEFNGEFRYKFFQVGTTNGYNFSRVNGTSDQSISFCAIDCNSLEFSTVPNDDLFLSRVDSFVYGLYCISARVFRDGTGGLGTATATATAGTKTCMIEKYNLVEKTNIPASAILISSYKTNAGNWIGLPPSEFDLLPFIFKNAQNSAYGYSLACRGMPSSSYLDVGGINYVMNYDQCEVLYDETALGVFANETGCTASTSGNGVRIDLDPTLISDSIKTKIIHSAGTNMQIQVVNASQLICTLMEYYSIQIKTNAVTKYQNVYKCLIQEYDDDGNLLPY